MTAEIKMRLNAIYNSCRSMKNNQEDWHKAISAFEAVVDQEKEKGHDVQPVVDQVLDYVDLLEKEIGERRNEK